MPKFFNPNDIDFIKTISEEVVDYLVEQWITLFKVSVGESKTNLYGESLGKVYHAPASLMCIVDREPQTIIYEGFGSDKTQAVEFRFNRLRLRTETIPVLTDINGTDIPVGAIQNQKYGYPEQGDVIIFDNTYYEIGQVKQEQLLGGMQRMFTSGSAQSEDLRMSLIAVAHEVRRSKIQIEDRYPTYVPTTPTSFDSSGATFDNTNITF